MSTSPSTPETGRGTLEALEGPMEDATPGVTVTITTQQSEFLASLRPDKPRSRESKAVFKFMRIKGFESPELLGVFEEDGIQFFYFRLSEGVLEVEVTRDPETDGLARRVSDFITDPAEVREMLGQ